MLRLFARPIGQTIHQPSVMFQVSFFFHKILQNSLHRPSHFFYKITKMKTKRFECPKSILNYEKKKILGTPEN